MTTQSPESIRPTKKQKELLSFIEQFIGAKGYSPSYREIMQGCGYTSVATVSLHVNNLIRRGHLHKRDRSARSLEMAKPSDIAAKELPVKQLNAAQEKWLIDKVEYFFKEIEAAPSVVEKELDKLYVLCGALKVLGQDGAANGFIARLAEIKKRGSNTQYSI